MPRPSPAPAPARAALVLDLFIDLLGAALAPPRCAACDAPALRLAVFCGACAATAERADAPPEAPPGQAGPHLAALVYGGAVARALVRFKYERRPDLARPLGDLLWSAVAPHAIALRGAVVVPVPLHPARLAERGYNQSALLASRVASRLGAACRALALARVHDTPQQATLDRAGRLENVAGAFRVRTPRAITGRRVLLIDDVRTTGSTLRAATAELLAAGALAVHTAVLAAAE